MKKHILLIGNNKYTKQAGQEHYHYLLINLLKSKYDCEIDEYHHNLHPLIPEISKPINNVGEFKSDFFDRRTVPPHMPTRLVAKNFKYSLNYFRKNIDLKKYDLIIDSTQGAFKYVDK
jgi:hypothetical protein